MQKNYFELFGLDVSFDVDKPLLAKKYRQLQMQVHPDKYASKSDREQRIAVEFAATVNVAYETLKSPVRRAEYLLSLAGHSVDHQKTTLADGEFLMLQMQWRESLSDISAAAEPADDQALLAAEEALEGLRSEVGDRRYALLDTFANHYQKSEWSLAEATLAKMHFVEKMLIEIEQLDARLFD